MSRPGSCGERRRKCVTARGGGVAAAKGLRAGRKSGRQNGTGRTRGNESERQIPSLGPAPPLMSKCRRNFVIGDRKREHSQYNHPVTNRSAPATPRPRDHWHEHLCVNFYIINLWAHFFRVTCTYILLEEKLKRAFFKYFYPINYSDFIQCWSSRFLTITNKVKIAFLCINFNWTKMQKVLEIKRFFGIKKVN